MRSILMKSLIGAVATVLLTAGTTSAADVLEIKVPFPFLVNGQTMPAGSYTITREGSSTSVLLIRGDKGNHAGAFVATVPADGRDPAGDTPAVTFVRHENQYRLSAIWESADEGMNVTR